MNRVGGLIGENNGTVSFAYAASAVSASGTDAGGLIGYDHASRSRIIANREVENSYWDITVSGINVSIAGDAGTGFSTSELQTPIAPGATVSEAFYQWNNADWDFGTATDYPILKDSEAQILPQQTIVLSNLIVEDSLTLVPAFDPNVFDYYIEVPSNQSQISLIITATDDDAIVSISNSANNNAPTIRGSGTVAIALNANPAATEIIIARSYRVRAIYPLAITISADPADKQVNEGQTARFTVAANAAGAIPLSYTWTQSNPTTPLLIEGIGTGITVQDPNFSIPIAADLVPPSATGLPIALDVKVTGIITGSPTTQSVTLTAIKVNDGIGSVALAAPEFVAGTTLLQVSNIAGAIAADPDGEAADADKNIRYQWQSAQHDETTWSDIANANSASFDISSHDELGHFQYRLRMHYIDAQSYEESLSSAATAIVDKDQDGLIELYHLEDLNAIRHSLAGESYISSSNATALTGGCPNAICRGYELRRDLDFLDNASYRNPSANRPAWTVSDFTDNNDRGWSPIGGIFSSIFDGNDHTLSNLQGNGRPTYFGLFYLTEDSTIRDINLSNVKIEATSDHAGGFVGEAVRCKLIDVSVSGEIINTAGNAAGLIGHVAGGCQIINSHAQVNVDGNYSGGLTGVSRGTFIINSYATGTIEGNRGAGGLVGVADHTRIRIINSYADVDVSASDGRSGNGGLIGHLLNSGSEVINSYAAGSVTANQKVGGLVGDLHSGSIIRNSYSIADLRNASGTINGLAGNANVSNSYWDIVASGQSSSASGSRKFTGQMQAGTAQSSNSGGVYYNWSETAWNFGTATQYPALKYVQHPDLNAEPICDAEGLPKCGTLLTPHLIYGLKDLSLMGAELSPPFSGRDYTGSAEAAASVNAIRLLPTAIEPNALIDIYDSDGKTLLQADLASGTPSQEFTFNAEMPTRHFIIEIKGTETARLSITLNRVEFIEINYLEDLNAIRDNLGSSYRLVRDLNFNDPTSYESGSVNPDWTVADFSSASDTGWEPIGTQSDPFTGIFEGNSYTIANLQINRDSASYVGLFGSAAASSLIHDIALVNVEIEGGSQTGGLVGNANGEIRNNYTTGKLSGGNNSGGLAGQSAGNIANSFSSVNVIGGSSNFIGGLVGIMTTGTITNSLARGTVSGGNSVGGLVGENGSGTITNSAASGTVSGAAKVGGLVGENKGIVRNSNAKGSVTATGSDIGGLVGRNTGTSVRIVNSYAIGDVEGNSWVGGLTGSNEGEVTKSFASGNVEGTSGMIGGLVAQNGSSGEITDSYASGTVSGGNLVGGLVGDNSGKVEGSNARGSVTATGDNIGGLVGRNAGTDAQITDSYASGDVEGGNSNLVGGLVGENFGEVSNSNARGSVTATGGDIGGLIGRNTGASAQITDSYAIGDVTGSRWVGGLTGTNGGKVIRSYARGNVTGTGTQGRIGGLVAENGSNGVIIGSVASGNVSSGTVSGNLKVGGLVGENKGEVINSSAEGTVDSDGNYVGGLVGENAGTDDLIINSHAGNVASSTCGGVCGDSRVGGLTGINRGKIINSWATGTVSSTGWHIGGLVGEHTGNGEIKDCYSTGAVSSDASTHTPRDRIGGLVGYMANETKVIHCYTISHVPNASGGGVGALIGWHPGSAADITRDVSDDNYWNISTTGETRSSGGVARTTAELQIPPGFNSSVSYTNWNTNNWDFGSFSQYPKLKYAANPNSGGTQSCGGTALPTCGSNISPPVPEDATENTEAEVGVKVEVIGATLNPAFDSNKSNYIGTVTNAVHGGRNSIQLRVTAPRLNDRIDIYVGNDEVPLSRDLTSGEISKDITLVFGGNRIIIEIKPINSAEMPLRYELNLIRQDPVRIEYLEDLNAIRNNLSGNYQLVRDLDFSIAGSYRDPGTNRPKWSKSTTGPGWVPIGEPDSIDETNGAMCNGEADSKCFTGNFNGNGYTISNLKMDSRKRFGGLFGAAEGGVIGNLGLVDVDLDDQSDVTVVLGGVVGYYQNGKLYNSHVTGGNSGVNAIGLIGPNSIGGGLVGDGRGISIINSYVDITMFAPTGAGLVYRLRGSNNEIINSYVDMRVSLTSNSGGLVGSADTVHIRNSYATGVLGTGTDSGGLLYQIDSGTIRNSYAAMDRRTFSSNADSFIHSVTGSTSVVNSYWDRDLNTRTDANAVGKTTAELQSPTGATGIYSGWSEDDWAFGTDKQYPILKYTDASETLGFAACGTANTPPCGSIISPGIHNRLIGLTLSGEDSLDPPFDVNEQEYIGIVNDKDSNRAIRVIPTAANASDDITVHIGDDETQQGDMFDSGTLSPLIILDSDGTQKVTIKIIPQGSSESATEYTLYLQLQINDINYLEDLDKIRDNLSSDYQLTRHLDFTDPGSYRSGTVNTDWLVNRAAEPEERLGWTPIGHAYAAECLVINCTDSRSQCFSGAFYGNGYTIANLQMAVNLSQTSFYGLFGGIDSDAVVRDLGLLNVKMEKQYSGNCYDSISGLVGFNDGTIIGSYATGIADVSGSSTAGGLVGINTGEVINSHAGVISQGNAAFGALVARNGNSILNSYASSIITGTDRASGLNGETLFVIEKGAIIRNSFAESNIRSANGNAVGGVFAFNNVAVENTYAAGAITVLSQSFDRNVGSGGIGGLGAANASNTSASYTISTMQVADLRGVGGIVGRLNDTASLNSSYFNSDKVSESLITPDRSIGAKSSEASVSNSFSQTTAQLKSGTAQSTTSSAVYYQWSEEDWDFGTSDEYPILKYAQNPNEDSFRACDALDLPNCGDLIAPQIRYGLSDLILAGNKLSPRFNDPTRENFSNYLGAVVNFNEDRSIQLIPTAKERSAMINIYINTVKGKGTPDQSIASGATSAPITLAKGVNRIVLEIVSTQTVQYPLYIQSQNPDRDGNGFAEIDNLEDLNAIRNNLSSNYELTRHLDFNDPNSYALGVANTGWTVDDFSDSNDTGWTPIGTDSSSFTGQLNGNGFTISNLQINRNRGGQGLFAFIAGSGIVRDLGLLNVEIESDIPNSIIDETDLGIGAFAARSNGTLMASYMVGNIRTNSVTGGLVGRLNQDLMGNGQILNSHAIGSVSGIGTGAVGGLVGNALGGLNNVVRIVNSYADVISNGGGVAGTCGSCTIYNSYAVGEAKGDNGAGFVTQYLSGIDIRNNYAHGDAKGGGGFFNLVGEQAGGLIGSNYSIGRTAGHFNSSGVTNNFSTSALPNYWNSDTADDNDAAVLNASGKTTEELQTPTTASGIYSQWRTANWDFGTSDEYPILKYTANPGGEQTCDGEGLPNCGDLIAPQIRFGLQNLTLADDVALTPPFGAAHRNLNGSYSGAVRIDTNHIRLIPTAQENDAMINIYISTVTGKDPDQSIASGTTSSEIALSNKGINRIVLEIVGTQTVQYPLYIKRTSDKDNNGFAEIDNLEDLNAIRNNLSGNYELTRHLDFKDPNSYASGIVNTDWTVDDFDDSNDTGWVPIGVRGLYNRNVTGSRFTGKLNGNGFTISNLQINRNRGGQGLFSFIDGSGIVRDLGLLNVEIESDIAVHLIEERVSGIGAFAALSRGTLMASYMVGNIRTNAIAGGLVGLLLNRDLTDSGQILNSYAIGSVSGIDTGSVGGLAGSAAIERVGCRRSHCQ